MLFIFIFRPKTDDNYSYFITTLPIHPFFLANNGVNGGGDNGIGYTENQDDKISKFLRKRMGDGANGGANGGVNGGVNEIINVLLNIPGLNAGEIATRTGKSLRTTERYLQTLRKNRIVEFRGVPKTGGYHLTDNAKDELK